MKSLLAFVSISFDLRDCEGFLKTDKLKKSDQIRLVKQICPIVSSNRPEHSFVPLSKLEKVGISCVKDSGVIRYASLTCFVESVESQLQSILRRMHAACFK